MRLRERERDKGRQLRRGSVGKSSVFHQTVIKCYLKNECSHKIAHTFESVGKSMTQYEDNSF